MVLVTDWSLNGAQESFDPIIDIGTGQDLVQAMVYAQALGDWDFTGMFTLILYRQVCSFWEHADCR